ncbi:S-adenosyl-L-methionine-dependent methyltransferase [Rhodocollybia butyracea]|uniref:DNA (cytosine-5-)-methyltransferase n=1 Tax=Rhodocollybia butyracea TaxID=206335 RepID=A0A9P5PZD1_9AGAR|nr:S-adenosyl-L-methionine-dependent methyltransferase [Rhodocollybia butyracea]KAF9071001.1 S-adenosyl-L-methionine-dependent methyltransferase [Rhodocollybia butyracea]
MVYLSECDIFGCKNEYDPETASFTEIRNEFYMFNYNNKTNNCPVCDIVQEESDKQIAMSVKNKTSLAFGGHEFHVHDYVLYSSCDGPGDIGQIVSFDFPRDTSSEPIMVSMKRLGQISSLKEIIPEEEMINERELFCSENHERNYNWVDAKSLIQICHVVAAKYRSIGIENWILHSPDHFYVRYCFPSLNVKTWDSKRCITRKEKTTLCALDVFGGCGAFGLALAEGSSSFDITHAIEIAPSTAQTYKLNSPETTVLNICVNDAVRYIIKKNLNKNNPDDTPITKATGEPVEFSLRPGDTEVLIAGFPWCTLFLHAFEAESIFNLQPTAFNSKYISEWNDIKTNLILPLLSLIDHLRQRIIILENVAGFLSCQLMGVQNGQHHIEGGIKQGALKLLISCLNEMGYQIQFSLLQAGHYGVPQGHV